MKTRIFALVSVALAAVAAVSVVAMAGPGAKALGGGQTEIGTRGAGDTIAFVAQEAEGTQEFAARGEVQYVDRTGGTGQGQVVYHGTVFCMEVVGNQALIEGTWDRPGGNFFLYVQDNGEPNQGKDIVDINPAAAAPNCGDQDRPDGDAALARGNVQVMP